ncbi:L-fucose:H+ symporter permease [Stakelama sediminis]|uniref:FHS family L-fucose permease-like MFS transporter n=1 Tax=Stakelama sediminis TaxID=463200 RepID=A0A840Z132_9SPHN|nr:sugar MFS transporter [Stakelama sediminis]MBB5719487.1 FHS family L-fucose permease-like MFS transporter [Stakelama sediminis]
MPGAAPVNPRVGVQGPRETYTAALAVLASLFFMWGFITVLNDILVPHLKVVFDLDYTQALLVQFVWFIAYFVMSIPSAKLLERAGYKWSIVIGLAIMAVGALGFIPASQFVSYGVFLAALFVLASGITLLQVAANPYVSVLGPPETSSSRLNLVQAMNSAGTMVAPLFGSLLILGRSSTGTAAHGAANVTLTEAQKLADAQSVQLPYVGIVVVLLLLAGVFAVIRLPDLGSDTRRVAREERGNHSLWKHRNLVFGIPAIFIYLIAEIGVGSLLISFITQPQIGAMTAEKAGTYLTLLWGGMMVGRFAGSFLMRFIKAETMLAGAAIGAFTLLMITIFGTGHISMWSLILVGLFHSIMFPTIFTLGIRGLGPLTEEGSGLLIMAIAGGALATGQGWLADHFGLQWSFLLPAACELYVLFYALWGCRPTAALPDEVISEPPVDAVTP